MKPIYIIFSGEGPHLEFVEVEDAEGNGVKADEWAKCDETVSCKCGKIHPLQRLGPFYTREAMLEVLNKGTGFTATLEDFVSYYRLRKRLEGTA